MPNINHTLSKLLQLPPRCVEATLHMRADAPPVLTIIQHAIEVDPAAAQFMTRTARFTLTPIADEEAIKPFDLEAECAAARSRLAEFIERRCLEERIAMTRQAAVRSISRHLAREAVRALPLDLRQLFS